jgi:CDP-diacylglycerol--glycerol-3-phosphate 3-phosphatidyltransferase
MPFNIPNSLTWARIALIPLFIGVYYLPERWMSGEEKDLCATAIFLVAAATDWWS